MSDAPPPGGYPPPGPPPPPGGYPDAGGYQPPPAPAPPPAPSSFPPPAAPPPGPPPGAPPTYQPPSPGGYPGTPPPQPGYAAGSPPTPGAYPSQQYGAPPPAKSNSGCIKALIIGVIVVVVLGVLGVVGSILLVGRAVNKTFGTADAADYSIDAAGMTCEITSSGTMTAEGELTNKTNHDQNYRVTVQFFDGSTKLGETFDTTGSLGENETGRFRVSTFTTDEPETVTCKVSDVSYNGS